jgi:phage shock protein C
MLTGVCGGLAQQFGIDPLLVRLGFILLTLAGSTGLVLYLLLWLIVPVEGSNEALGHRLPFPGRRAASPE